jgi:hypothetical protein
VFSPDELPALKEAVAERTKRDRELLERLRDEVRPLRGEVRSIKPRSTTATSLVASDGGNNKLAFDPFYIQLVRVVDSYGKQLLLDTVSPTSDTDEISARQFDAQGKPRTALGRMMDDLGVKQLHSLSHMIPRGETCRNHPERVSPSWVLVYRDLCEWAVLYDRICFHTFATDTLIVRDGLLRSKMFRDELFIRWTERVEAAIGRIRKDDKRKVLLVGVAKHSKVLSRYQLAIALEDIMSAGEPRYVQIPREIEAKAYVWPEYARGTDEEGSGGEAPKFVAGKLFLVRFGARTGDPIWAIDVFESQSDLSSEIFGYLLSDAIDGFPIPLYPRCLQKAHEHAEIVGFDLDLLQEEIFNNVRDMLSPGKRTVLDAFRLNPNPSGRRYE